MGTGLHYVLHLRSRLINTSKLNVKIHSVPVKVRQVSYMVVSQYSSVPD